MVDTCLTLVGFYYCVLADEVLLLLMRAKARVHEYTEERVYSLLTNLLLDMVT